MVLDPSSEEDKEHERTHEKRNPDEHPYEAPDQRMHLGALRVRAILVVVHDHRDDYADDTQDQSQKERSQGLGLLGDRGAAASGRGRADAHTACRAERTPFRAFLSAVRAIHGPRMPLLID